MYILFSYSLIPHPIMFFFILYTVTIVLMYECYVHHRHKFVKAFEMYCLFKQTADPDGKLGHIRVLWNACRSLAFFAYEMYSNMNVPSSTSPHEKFNNKYLKIPFRYHDASYFYLLKIPHGVIPIESIVNEAEHNVTDEILPYLGPNLDCNGTRLTPADFGYKKLTLATVVDRRAVFEENDAISLQ